MWLVQVHFFVLRRMENRQDRDFSLPDSVLTDRFSDAYIFVNGRPYMNYYRYCLVVRRAVEYAWAPCTKTLYEEIAVVDHEKTRKAEQGKRGEEKNCSISELGPIGS